MTTNDRPIDPHDLIQANPDSPLDEAFPPTVATWQELQEYDGGSGGKTGIDDMRDSMPATKRVTPGAEPALPAAPPVERS